VSVLPWPDRFWAKVEKTETCWLWRGTTTRPVNGYGQIRLDRRMVTSHRVAYELLVGPIPEGLELDHLCRVRHCVNPVHLEPVTPHENLLRGEGPAARHARKTHCHRGHPLSGANLRMCNGGRSRRCRECKRENDLRSQEKRRQHGLPQSAGRPS
jgi:hypothetical protein